VWGIVLGWLTLSTAKRNGKFVDAVVLGLEGHQAKQNDKKMGGGV
jgi:hypothetical protein